MRCAEDLGLDGGKRRGRNRSGQRWKVWFRVLGAELEQLSEHVKGSRVESDGGVKGSDSRRSGEAKAPNKVFKDSPVTGCCKEEVHFGAERNE